MRCWLAALILCAAFPLIGHAANLDSNHAERLIWEGHFQEAAQYLEKMFQARAAHAERYLCLTYVLWGVNDDALYYCSLALQDGPYPLLTDCVIREMRGQRAVQGPLCSSGANYDRLAELKALQALAYWRDGNAKEAEAPLDIAHAALRPPGWLVQLIAIAIRTPEDQQRQRIHELYQRTAAAEKPRFDRAYTQFFPELITKIKAEEAAQRQKIEAAAAAQARQRYVITSAFGALALLAAAAAFHQRARLAAFLSATPSATVAQPSPPGVPAPYPSYWQAGYMNRAYQLAAWCWVAVWILVCLPLVLLLAIPALTILGEFSADGLQSAIANTKGFAAGFLGWGQIWFALLLLALSGFAVFKVYGRYSLPKPFRPRIRVIRTTLRLVFLAVTLLSVGTFLSYFAGMAAGLYTNPIVRMLIDLLRTMFGF